MRRQHRRKYTLPLTASVLAVGAVGLFWLLTDTPAPAPSLAAVPVAPAARPASPAATGPSPTSVARPLDTLHPVVVSTSLESNTPIPQALARPGSPLDVLRQRVMAENPDLARFRQLQRKVLRRAEETQALQALFNDSKVVDTAKRDLLAKGELRFTDEAQFRRLYQVEYLGMGVEWQDNPEREARFKDIEQLILANNIQPDMDLELRRSLAGDKVELFMILLHNDRPRAEALLLKTQGTRLAPLLENARVRFDALWALANK
ncbi:hypothetical protein D7V97_34610 [Corallococcus sp. CA053C]|uniref:hypothetical protein n=1 Tax=Corallococcus sp. CA053C TaxID=2316732 RepID=UPI000EA226A8|nr:hypothetical protein [Corallococcus sp. CA053C]RKG97177.1 hypothetical protein D7V97_34610 [Corallococcus sp. CA053C]